MSEGVQPAVINGGSCVGVGNKRRRKTEKQLSVLQSELQGANVMWNRDKINDIAQRTGMTETQIYKWWWDQTRKRVKRLNTYFD